MSEESDEEVKSEKEIPMTEEIPKRTGSRRSENGMAATLEEDEPGDQAYLKLSQYVLYKIWLFISICLAMAEPIIIAYPDTLVIQKGILAVSTILFVMGFIAVMIAIPEGGFFFRLRHACQSEVYIEIVCLVIGWVLFFTDPVMAPLRCFRLFRFVWYSEFYPANPETLWYPITFFCHTVLQYLEKLGSELFTTNSRGGVIVLGFFFYSAYIMGILFWQATRTLALSSPEGGSNGTLSECDTAAHCFLIMLRLTFFDGSGFDFLKSIMDYGNGGWAFLLILYMIFSALVLLNGLIGIFGGAFSEATLEDEAEEEAEKEKLEKETIQGIMRVINRIEDSILKLQEDIKTSKQRNK